MLTFTPYFSGRGTIPQYPPIPRVSITKEQNILVAYNNAYAKPKKGRLTLTREQLLTMKPGRYSTEKAKAAYHNIPNIRAVNRGATAAGLYTLYAAGSRPAQQRPQAGQAKGTYDDLYR